jgi:hypothetical protein
MDPQRPRRFSLFRFINNAVPSFQNNSSPNVDLSEQQKDAVFEFQIGQPNPKLLHPLAYYVSGLLGEYRSGASVSLIEL